MFSIGAAATGTNDQVFWAQPGWPQLQPISVVEPAVSQYVLQ
jgi:hypothetical protein